MILNDSIGRAALFDYLKSGYSEHHLTFWEEIEFHYKKDWSEGSVSHHNDAVARQLYERFIKNGAHAQINITEPQRVKLQKAIENIGTKGQTEEQADDAPPQTNEEASATEPCTNTHTYNDETTENIDTMRHLFDSVDHTRFDLLMHVVPVLTPISPPSLCSAVLECHTDSNGNLQSATSDLFDEAASTCLELIKGNYFFPFQQSKQYQTYQNEKKQREDAKAKEEKKSNACCIL